MPQTKFSQNCGPLITSKSKQPRLAGGIPHIGPSVTMIDFLGETFSPGQMLGHSWDKIGRSCDQFKWPESDVETSQEALDVESRARGIVSVLFLIHEGLLLFCKSDTYLKQQCYQWKNNA